MSLKWFLAIFRDIDIKYVKEIENTLIKKVKESDEYPFFNDGAISKMIMEIWSSNNHLELQNYILKHLDTKENVYLFFKCFVSFWNTETYGVFRCHNFDYLINILKLDSDLIFNKVKM